MDQRRLGNTEFRVTSIGLGCVTFGREIDPDNSFAVMDRAVERGINLFDTAEVYGEGASESLVGQWLQSRNMRDAIVLATKVIMPMTREHILSAAEQSLARLRTDRIDLYQLHGWDHDTPLEETCAALAQLQHQGKIKAVGVSNLTLAQLERMIALQRDMNLPTTAAVQPRYSLVSREIEADMLPYCEMHNLGVLAYSPLGAGFLTGKYSKIGPLPSGARFDIKPAHQNIYFHDKLFAIVDRLKAYAQQIDQPLPRIALSWALGRPRVTAVLIGARNPQQVDQSFDADALHLTDEQLAELDRLSADAK
ncbi:MAG: aldo/keto reductase [Phycisphaeraceae bacterium]|nr:aldo/keto reductase [Phycisphaeraceae bacterium]